MQGDCVRIYLAGPINGCTDEEATGWREEAKRALVGYDVLDPMVRDYRGHEDANFGEIVDADLRDIQSCDVVLVNAARPSWGTAMEIRYAWGQRIPVIAIVPNGQSVSPWLRYHCRAVELSLEDAIVVLGLMD